MRLSLKQYVELDEHLPWGYGVAYMEFYVPYLVAYPVPINLIVRFMRWFWHILTMWRPTKLDQELRKAYDKGHDDTIKGKYLGY